MPIPIFKKRTPDYRKHPQSTKPLEKDPNLFTKSTEEETYGGFGGALGLHNKATKSSDSKGYYLARHRDIEYLVMEVLCQLGLNTPKTRFLSKATDFKSSWKTVATLGLSGYIPMTALLDLFYYRDKKPPKELQEINKLYRLNPQNQTIIDLKTGKEYKISGNLFASNIAGLFVQDNDFQAEGLNLGVVKQGNRFFAVLIDKDMCTIDGAPIERILRTITQDIIRSDIFNHTLTDQKLAIIDEISKIIEKKEESPILEQIFLSARVLNSNLSYDYNALTQMAHDLKETGASIVSYFTKDDPAVLAGYRRREEIRASIADEVIEKLMLATKKPEKIDKEALKAIIIEDLRAPYYQTLYKQDRLGKADVGNNNLINAIMNDQVQELIALELLSQEEVKSALTTNKTAASGTFLSAYKEYIQTLLERPSIKISFSLKKGLRDILTSIENDEFLFDNPRVDIKDLVQKMDKIMTQSGESGFWKSHQSPAATWYEFKKEHASALEFIHSADAMINSMEEPTAELLKNP